MARQQYQINMPAEIQGQAFPAGLRQQVESALPQYQRQASATSYYEDHPYKAMLRGVLGGAGINSLFMPGMVEESANQRRAKAVTDFNAFYKNAIENQKNLDGLAQPRNEAMFQQSLTDEAKRQGMIQPTAPDLYQRDLPGMDGTAAQQPDVPVYSREFLDSMRKGMFGGSDINYLQNMQNHNRQINYNMPSNALGGIAGNAGAPLQASAKVQGGMPETPTAPFFVSDPQTIMQQMTSAGNNAFDAGQKRFEFDQEAPKRMAEIQKLITEGKATEALALLRAAQTQTEQKRPALIDAQTGETNASASLKNRTDPNLRGGGGGSANPALVDAQRVQDLIKGQRDAVFQQMALEGFYSDDKKTFTPPGNEGGFMGSGWGGQPNQEKLQRFNQLKRTLDTLQNSLAGGAGRGGSATPATGKATTGGGAKLSSGRTFNP